MAQRARRALGKIPAPGVAVLVAVLTLIPTVTMLALAGSAAQRRWDEHQATQQVQQAASTVRALTAFQAAVTDEVIYSGAFVAADQYDLESSVVQEILGFDPAVEMAAARAVVDAQLPPSGAPALMRDLDALGTLRRAIDTGLSSVARVNSFQAAFRLHTATALGEELARLVGHSAATDGGGDATEQAVAAARLLLLAFREASDLLGFVDQILTTGGTAAERDGVAEAAAGFRLAMDEASVLLGERAHAAADRLRSAATTERLEALVTQVRAAGELPPASSAALDPAAYGRALNDGAAWLAGVSDVLEASSEDVWLSAARQEQAATTALQRMAVAVAVVLALVVVTTFAIGRSLIRTAAGLAATARRIATGDFHAPQSPAPAMGPRELRAIGAAMTDLTDVLIALEAYVTNLADDPGSAALDHPLPGATGRALQVTVDRLRAELKLDEQTRARLAEVAAHDALTGLLNRGAALAAIEHELNEEDRRSPRSGVVALLFIDLDGLKDINDTHGHAAGDAAIRLTADALRRATRRADIVARFGGDEFVVAMRAQAVATVAALAARIQGTLADTPLTLGSASVAVRCSIGVALAAPSVGADELLRRADAALYRAKEAGRGCVAWHEAPGPGVLLAAPGPAIADRRPS